MKLKTFNESRRLRTRVFDFCNTKYRNLSELAQVMGICVSEIYRVRQGKRPINEKFITGATKAFPEHTLEQLFQAVKSGAAGYLSKNVTADKLALAIKRIHRREHIITEAVLTRPRVAERVLKQFQDTSLVGAAMKTLATTLTPRELELLTYVARGYLNKQIGHKLSCSEQTIKNHMSSILRKLDANDRTQAVVMAIHYGWISLKLDESL